MNTALFWTNMTDFLRAQTDEASIKLSADKPVDASLLPPIRALGPESAEHIAEFEPRPDAAPEKPVRIAVKTKGKILLFNPEDILAVEAEGNYVLLQRHSDSNLLRESITTIAEKLKAYGFVRIHRSVLVNASWVQEIRPGATGEYILRIANGKEYTVSRTYKNNLKLLAQSWIGIDSFIED
jgi:DNA-binding LytR/AlgR family response regulator